MFTFSFCPPLSSGLKLEQVESGIENPFILSCKKLIEVILKNDDYGEITTQVLSCSENLPQHSEYGIVLKIKRLTWFNG